MSNCGCDGNNNNLNILQRNNLLPGNTGNNGVLNVQSMNNMPQVNNFPQVNNQPVQVIIDDALTYLIKMLHD